jgi:hypothetical protein
VKEPAAAAASTRFRDRFDRPVFIVSSPRSGSTLLFETLAHAPDLCTVGGESHWLIEDIPGLSPAERRWSSNRLTAEDATPERIEQLAGAFYRALQDREGRPASGRIRMLEKTPKNALRVPFFDAAFPDAMFVYLYRDVRQTLGSMLEAWASGAFCTYPELPGWRGHPWSLLLLPGWERLIGQPLPVIVAHQWAVTTDLLLDDLAEIPRDRVRGLDHGEFLAQPQKAMVSLAGALGLCWDRSLGGDLPLSRTTLSRPAPDKWRRFEEIIESVRPIVERADARARAFVDSLRS